MARKIPIAEARSNLTSLVREVERGKRVELTRRGRRVAVVISCDEYDRLHSARPDLGEALRAWRESLPADFEGISRQEVDSWRDRSSPRKAQFP
jgi:prevent-host-death family protein